MKGPSFKHKYVITREILFIPPNLFLLLSPLYFPEWALHLISYGGYLMKSIIKKKAIAFYYIIKS